MVDKHPSEWVREMTVDIRTKRDTYKQQRDQLLSAIKQHRNATESRLRLLAASTRQPEASDLMLKPDRDLYDLADAIERGEH